MAPAIAIVVFAVVLSALLALVAVLHRRQSKAVTVDRTELIGLQNRWQAPAELLAAPMPRSVRLTTDGKVVYGVMAAFLVGALVLGGILLASASRAEDVRQRLEREGVTTKGQILRKWETGGKSKTRYVVYSFEAGDRIYQRQASIRPSAYSRLRLGDRVVVRYAATDPAVSRLSLEAGQLPSWVALFPVGLFPLMMLLVSWPVRSQKRLLQWGVPAGAIVTRIMPTKGGKSVRYEFLDMTGNPVSGHAVLSGKRVPPLRGIVTVLYDPQRPHRSTLYPAQMVAIRS